MSRHQKQQEPASVSASDFGIERVNQDESLIAAILRCFFASMQPGCRMLLELGHSLQEGHQGEDSLDCEDNCVET